MLRAVKNRTDAVESGNTNMTLTLRCCVVMCVTGANLISDSTNLCHLEFQDNKQGIILVGAVFENSLFSMITVEAQNLP